MTKIISTSSLANYSVFETFTRHQRTSAQKMKWLSIFHGSKLPCNVAFPLLKSTLDMYKHIPVVDTKYNGN